MNYFSLKKLIKKSTCSIWEQVQTEKRKYKNKKSEKEVLYV